MKENWKKVLLIVGFVIVTLIFIMIIFNGGYKTGFVEGVKSVKCNESIVYRNVTVFRNITCPDCDPSFIVKEKDCFKECVELLNQAEEIRELVGEKE